MHNVTNRSSRAPALGLHGSSLYDPAWQDFHFQDFRRAPLMVAAPDIIYISVIMRTSTQPKTLITITLQGH